MRFSRGVMPGWTRSSKKNSLTKESNGTKVLCFGGRRSVGAPFGLNRGLHGLSRIIEQRQRCRVVLARRQSAVLRVSYAVFGVWSKKIEKSATLTILRATMADEVANTDELNLAQCCLEGSDVALRFLQENYGPRLR